MPAMDVLHHLTLRTLVSLEQQREKLHELGLFNLGADGDVQREGKEVFGPELDDSIEDPADKEGMKEDDSVAVNQDMDVHAKCVWAWEKRKPKLHTSTPWLVLPCPSRRPYGNTLRNRPCLARKCVVRLDLLSYIKTPI